MRVWRAAAVMCAALAHSSVFAQVSPESVLEEVRALRKTVQEQERKIADLESRLSGGADDPGAARSCKKPAADAGIEIGVSVTSVLQSVSDANGDDMLSKSEDVTDGSYSANLTFEKEFGDYGYAFAYLLASEGGGVDEELKLFSGVNADASDGDNRARLSEVWYEHYFRPLPLTVTAGRIDPVCYIDDNAYAYDETTQFLGSIFTNSPVIEFPEDSASGLRLGYEASKLAALETVIMDADIDGEDIFDSLFLAHQITLRPGFGARPGNYRFILWRNNSSHTHWLDSAREKEYGWGAGVSFDQELTDAVGLFLRYGWQDPDVFLPGDSFSLERSYSFGPRIQGDCWGRPFDELGIGFGEIVPSKKYKEATGSNAENESHLEMYYNCRANEHLRITPDLHIVWRPYGKDAANGDGTIVVTGIRGQLDF